MRRTRALAGLSALALACGCGSQPPESGVSATRQNVDTESTPPSGSACTTLTIVAKKTYHPTKWKDGNEEIPSPRTFRLPAEIEVDSGNAGDWRAEFRFHNGTEPEVTCTYVGGSHSAHPVGHRERELGEDYHFRSCNNGAQAGQPIVGTSFTLHINGDSDREQTKAKITLEEVAPCGTDFGVATYVPFPEYTADDIDFNPSVGFRMAKRSLLIGVKAETTAADVASIVASTGGQVAGALPGAGIVLVTLSDGTDFDTLETVRANIAGDPRVDGVVEDLMMGDLRAPTRRTDNPAAGKPLRQGGSNPFTTRPYRAYNLSLKGLATDEIQPRAAGHWGLAHIQAPEAWNIVDHLTQRVRVGVIDVDFEDNDDLHGILTLADRIQLGGDGGIVTSPAAFIPSQSTLFSSPSHGTETSGVIGAHWNNGEFIDGVSPLVDIVGYVAGVPQSDNNELAVGRVMEATTNAAGGPFAPGPARVINMSIGFNWSFFCYDPQGNQGAAGTPGFDQLCDPAENDATLAGNRCGGQRGVGIRNRIATAGRLYARTVNSLNPLGSQVFVVVAAGNDAGAPFDRTYCSSGDVERRGFGAFPAVWNSPMAFAALMDPLAADHMMVAEGLEASDVCDPQSQGGSCNVFRWKGSSVVDRDVVGSSLFAPAANIQTLGGGVHPSNKPKTDLSWVTDSTGTSFAAPYIAGAASLLLSKCPGMTNKELKTALLAGALQDIAGTAGTRTRQRLALHSSLLQIDTNPAIVNCTKDVRKSLSDMNDGTADGFTRVALFGNGAPPLKVATFQEQPDQHVDMRDFRRLRDLFLLSNGGEVDFGVADPSNNPARDLNQDGVFGQEDLDEIHTRGLLAPRGVNDPLVMTNADLEIFKPAYAAEAGTPGDRMWPGAALDALYQNSADLVIETDAFLKSDCTPTPITIRVSGEATPGDPLPADLSPLSKGVQVNPDVKEVVITTPLRNNVKIEVDKNGTTYKDVELPVLNLRKGEDHFFVLNPLCAITDFQTGLLHPYKADQQCGCFTPGTSTGRSGGGANLPDAGVPNDDSGVIVIVVDGGPGDEICTDPATCPGGSPTGGGPTGGGTTTGGFDFDAEPGGGSALDHSCTLGVDCPGDDGGASDGGAGAGGESGSGGAGGGGAAGSGTGGSSGSSGTGTGGSSGTGTGGGSPGKGPIGGGWGDPHLYTWDRRAYDFQAVGEFVLATDDHDFVVQGRLLPWGTSQRVAGIMATAFGVAGDRVGFYADDQQFVRINGVKVELPIPGSQTLDHGGIVSRGSEKGFDVTWPSGHTAHVQFYTRTFGGTLDLQLALPATLVNPVRGPLGTADGSSANDFTLRDGTVLTGQLTSDQLYGQFGESWRLGQSESLFDYDAGKNTDTYTNRSFPASPITAASLPAEVYTSAKAACTAQNVTDPVLLDACILDVGVSGDPSVAQGAASVASATASTGGPPLEPAPVQPPGTSDDSGGFTWDPTTETLLPASSTVPEETVHGPVSGELEATVNTPLPSHNSVTITYEMDIVGPWSGDGLTIIADNQTVSTTSFSNTPATQAFPDQLGNATHPPQTGAIAVDVLPSGETRTVYRQTYTFLHSAPTLALRFATADAPATQKIAIRDLVVTPSLSHNVWQPSESDPSSCRDILASGKSVGDGIYQVAWQNGSAIVRLPVFCDMTTDGGGWTMLYKKSSGVIQNADDLWTLAPENETASQLLDRDKETLDYSSSLITHTWEAFTQARVEIVKAGLVAQFIKFDTTGTDDVSWFTSSRHIDSSWTDLPTDPNWNLSQQGRYFSLNPGGRSWYINATWGGCPNDHGWLMVSNQSTCSWELPFVVLYSVLPTVANNINSAQYQSADALIVTAR